MATDGVAGAQSAMAPAEWPTEPERRYARRQAALADHYGIDIVARTVETAAVGRVHYIEAGAPDGDPVVMLHGQSTTAATWLPMLPGLADEYRLIVPDRPGRGLSATPTYRSRNLRSVMVAYLLDLFDALALQRPDVVANSLGGQQAALLTVDHDRVDRLCFVGGPACVSTQLAPVLRLAGTRGFDRLIDWLVSRGDPVENARGMTNRLRVTDDSALPDAFFELLAAGRTMPERQRSLRSLSRAQSSFGRMHPLFDLTDEMADIDRPTCFLWGTDDQFWPPETGRPVAERMADATFHELSGHGHCPWLEPGDEAGTRVRSFLDSG